MMIYLMLFTLCIAVELSEKINTDNIFKKVGIGFIAVGSLLAFSAKHTSFIEIGIIVYLMSNVASAYLSQRKRRATDE